MNGSPHNRIQISVFDKVLLERDLSATVIRTYTLTNVSDEPTSVEISRTEEFYPPVRQFQCPNPTANVQIVPSESEETSQVSWSLARHTLDPDESVSVEFSFKREFLKVEPPLKGEFEYSSAERVIYSIEVIAPYRELLEFSDITITPEPMDSGKASFDKTDEGHLVVSPRRLSMNKGGKLSLRIQSNPPSVDTLPLLRILANQAKQEGVSISDLSVIIIPHLLTDFLSLVDALEAVGLDPERTFIIGIPYSLKLHVVVRLYHRGYKNIWAPSEYPFEQEIDEVIKATVESVQSKGGKILEAVS